MTPVRRFSDDAPWRPQGRRPQHRTTLYRGRARIGGDALQGQRLRRASVVPALDTMPRYRGEVVQSGVVASPKGAGDPAGQHLSPDAVRGPTSHAARTLRPSALPCTSYKGVPTTGNTTGCRIRYRTRVGRGYNRAETLRRIATRVEQLATHYLAMATIAALVISL